MYNEDEKKYPVQGTVTISTEEYKDLVKTVMDKERESNNYRDKYWTEQSKVNDLEKRLNELRAEADIMQAFIAQQPERTQEYFRFRNTPKEE